MSEGQTAAQQDNPHHLATNFAFLPFVVQLLSDKLPSQGVQPLPIGEPDALTLEAVEAVQDIVNQATMSYLCQRAGWRKRQTVLPSEERPVEVRSWDPQVWRNLTLRFSAASLDSLLIAYNLTRKAPKASELRSGTMFSEQPTKQSQDPTLHLAQSRGESVQTLQIAVNNGVKASIKHLKKLPLPYNGDMLIHHLVFARLNQLVQLDEGTSKAFYSNPLNLMTHFFQCSNITDDHIDSLQDLLSPNIAPLLPWLGVIWSKRWTDIEDQRWYQGKGDKARESFHLFNKNQMMLFTAWYSLAEEKERPDLLVPLLDYYTALFETHGPHAKWVDRFRRMTSELRHVERTDYAEQWARAMMPALTLRRAYEDARDLHPIDREAPHHLFMDAYKRKSFDTVLSKIEDLLATLQPKIG